MPILALQELEANGIKADRSMTRMVYVSAKGMETEMVHLHLQVTSHVRIHAVFKLTPSHPKAFLSSY